MCNLLEPLCSSQRTVTLLHFVAESVNNSTATPGVLFTPRVVGPQTLIKRASVESPTIDLKNLIDKQGRSGTNPREQSWGKDRRLEYRWAFARLRTWQILGCSTATTTFLMKRWQELHTSQEYLSCVCADPGLHLGSGPVKTDGGINPTATPMIYYPPASRRSSYGLLPDTNQD